MQNKVRELRGLIYKYYDTEAAFARELGWTRQQLNKITNGKKTPSISEVDILSEKLSVPIEYMAQIFLPTKSTNGQQT
ncbi:MAG: helix-turn-helix domain-containing protein [Defluviitaleaceae bacterium]|nr:helix-turn-helix domain-containing protein [Defluviitaleaceae bacterium]